MANDSGQKTKSSEPAGANSATLQLGHRLYERYAISPGVMSLDVESGLAARTARFSESRVPLVHLLHRRWSVRSHSPRSISLGGLDWRTDVNKERLSPSVRPTSLAPAEINNAAVTPIATLNPTDF